MRTGYAWRWASVATVECGDWVCLALGLGVYCRVWGLGMPGAGPRWLLFRDDNDTKEKRGFFDYLSFTIKTLLLSG